MKEFILLFNLRRNFYHADVQKLREILLRSICIYCRGIFFLIFVSLQNNDKLSPMLQEKMQLTIFNSISFFKKDVSKSNVNANI